MTDVEKKCYICSLYYGLFSGLLNASFEREGLEV